jgi:hypothetical protein
VKGKNIEKMREAERSNKKAFESEHESVRSEMKMRTDEEEVLHMCNKSI